jgi:5-methylcytosine-specific restriction endonuclease McrA
MRTCEVNNCDKKHHAKGMCKTHYGKHKLPLVEKGPCSIEDCTNASDKKGWCTKHYTRWLRHGDPLTTTRFRNFSSLRDFICNSSEEEVLSHEFKSRTQWGYACKLYYGDKCSKCGWNEATCDAHHIVPVSDGGKNIIPNCVIICPNCHAKEHRKPPITFDSKGYSQKVIFDT